VQKIMLKQQLEQKVREKTGLTLKDAKASVDAFIQTVTEALASGDRVLLTGFGSFLVRHRRPRVGVNPQKPSEKINLPEAIIPAFKAGKSLKDAVAKSKKK
jgi:DNA-binding protein HU-beta